MALKVRLLRIISDVNDAVQCRIMDFIRYLEEKKLEAAHHKFQRRIL